MLCYYPSMALTVDCFCLSVYVVNYIWLEYSEQTFDPNWSRIFHAAKKLRFYLQNFLIKIVISWKWKQIFLTTLNEILKSSDLPSLSPFISKEINFLEHLQKNSTGSNQFLLVPHKVLAIQSNKCIKLLNRIQNLLSNTRALTVEKEKDSTTLFNLKQPLQFHPLSYLRKKPLNLWFIRFFLQVFFVTLLFKLEIAAITQFVFDIIFFNYATQHFRVVREGWISDNLIWVDDFLQEGKLFNWPEGLFIRNSLRNEAAIA